MSPPKVIPASREKSVPRLAWLGHPSPSCPCSSPIMPLGNGAGCLWMKEQKTKLWAITNLLLCNEEGSSSDLYPVLPVQTCSTSTAWFEGIISMPKPLFLQGLLASLLMPVITWTPGKEDCCAENNIQAKVQCTLLFCWFLWKLCRRSFATLFVMHLIAIMILTSFWKCALRVQPLLCTNSLKITWTLKLKARRMTTQQSY